MSDAERIKHLWLKFSDDALSLAAARDSFLRLPACEDKFFLMQDAYEAANALSDGAAEYVAFPKPLIGKKPDEAVEQILNAAQKMLAAIEALARSDHDLLRVADDGQLTVEQKIIFLQSRVNNKANPEELRSKCKRALEIAVKMQSHEKLKRALEP